MEFIEIILTWIGSLALLYFLYSFLTSEASTKKGAFLESVSKVADKSGQASSYAAGWTAHKLKNLAIETEFKKMDLGADFSVESHNDNTLLVITPRLNYEFPKKASLSPEKREQLIAEGRKIDNIITSRVDRNDRFFEKCKRMGIQHVIVSGCTLMYYDDATPFKEDKVLLALTITEYGMEKKPLP